MTVLLNSTSTSDHAIGITAMSKHQGFWSHSPQRPFENQVGDFGKWLADNLGQGSSRLCRTPLTEQFTGHTAVMSRVAGHVTFVKGFVPNVSGYLYAFFGRGGGGHWQNDIGMLGDPTCISFEVPVTQNQANGFSDWFNTSSTVINVYALKKGNAIDSFNCVLGAVTVLVNYLDELGGYSGYVEQLLSVTDSMQGHLMQGISGGFQ
jgi:hypothetical protein